MQEYGHKLNAVQFTWIFIFIFVCCICCNLADILSACLFSLSTSLSLLCEACFVSPSCLHRELLLRCNITVQSFVEVAAFGEEKRRPKERQEKRRSKTFKRTDGHGFIVGIYDWTTLSDSGWTKVEKRMKHSVLSTHTRNRIAKEFEARRQRSEKQQQHRTEITKNPRPNSKVIKEPVIDTDEMEKEEAAQNRLQQVLIWD